MKKHPVDDIFRNRLADFDKKPTENTWNRIQERTEKQRKPVIWIWYAAASVAIAIVTGYMIFRSEDSGVNQSQGTGRELAISKKENITDDDVQTLDSAAVKHEPSSSKQIGQEKQAIPETQFVNKKSRIDKVEETELIEATQPLTAMVPESRNQQIIVQDLNLPEIKEVEQESVPNVHDQKKPIDEPARTIVIAVETNSDVEESIGKKSRFSRVFRQLKNARAGERVDWNEVGFRPKDLIAKVDDRLRNKEEKSSEK